MLQVLSARLDLGPGCRASPIRSPRCPPMRWSTGSMCFSGQICLSASSKVAFQVESKSWRLSGLSSTIFSRFAYVWRRQAPQGGMGYANLGWQLASSSTQVIIVPNLFLFAFRLGQVDQFGRITSKRCPPTPALGPRSGILKRRQSSGQSLFCGQNIWVERRIFFVLLGTCFVDGTQASIPARLPGAIVFLDCIVFHWTRQPIG